MAGLFDTLGNASRSLSVVQRSIATTGHNIANVNTPGYSRQRNVYATSRPEINPAGNIGTGVESISVERAVDRFVQERLYDETARLGSINTVRNAYRDVEGVINEQAVDGVSAQLSSFFDAMDALANSGTPGQPLERSQLLAAGQSLVADVRRADLALREIQSAADRGMTGALAEINALTDQIGALNLEIKQVNQVAPANDLIDRRDQLILDLSEKIGVSTLTDEDGMVSVRIGSGYALVNGVNSNDLVAVVDPSNVNTFDPTYSGVYLQGSSTLVNVTSIIEGGELGGHIDVRDRVAAGAIRDLDAFVATVSTSFNSAHRAGLGLVDGAPHDFFVDYTGAASIDNAARLFDLSADIDPGQGGDLDNIAAGSVPAPGGAGEAAQGDTNQARQMADLRDQEVAAYLSGDPGATPSGGTISVTNQLLNFMGAIGRDAAGSERVLAQQTSIVSTVQDRRDETSGVSIDEEVATLVQLQASFQANARVMTTASSLLDDLLNAF